MQKFVQGGTKLPFCKFHGIVRVKTFFNILRAISGNLYVTLTGIMAGNDTSRFSEGERAHRTPLRTPLQTGRHSCQKNSGEKKRDDHQLLSVPWTKKN